MEANIKPNTRLMELLCSIRGTMNVVQSFINDHEDLSPTVMDSSIIDLAGGLNAVQDYLSKVSGNVSDCIGAVIIGDVDRRILEESLNNITESQDVKMKLSSIEMRKSKKTA